MTSPYGNHLPIFPTYSEIPCEDYHERIVERLVDRADTAFLKGQCSQEQYDAWFTALKDWADNQQTWRHISPHG